MSFDALTGKHKGMWPGSRRARAESRPAGFCFIEYEVPEAAAAALQMLSGGAMLGMQCCCGSLRHVRCGRRVC